MQKKQWVIQPPNTRAAELARSLNIPALLAQVLVNRQITDAQSGTGFLNPKLTELIEPERMPGCVEAVRRIRRAVENHEKITIYGDYDVDGITGVAILSELLRLLGATVDYYIPHRIDEGYGLNSQAVQSLAESGSRLLITVDCGISAVEAALLAKKLGVELIITDHHRPAADLPAAAAIVHPALEPGYPNPDSSGAMVAFKLAWAVANEFNPSRKLTPALREFMLNATSLAAMGTIADVVDLRGENRILTSYGLKSLPRCGLCGVQALIDCAGLSGQGLDSYDIGFRLAPMLNAAGRMGHARLAVELLSCDSPARAVQIADYLKQQNELRRRCEQKIFKQACEVIIERGLNHPDRRSIVLAGQDWHTGVIGIVASRLIERFCLPTILINSTADVSQGSGRSVQGFDILAAISACGGDLVHFGGHEMAAGITIQTERIDSFAAGFEQYARRHLKHDDTVDRLRIDALAPLREFQKQTVEKLQMLGPFGQGNPRPLFATKGVRLSSPPRKVGARSDHLQLAITDNTTSVRCIGFGMGRFEKKLLEHDFFNVAYEAQIDNYNGGSSVQLVLADIQFE